MSFRFIPNALLALVFLFFINIFVYDLDVSQFVTPLPIPSHEDFQRIWRQAHDGNPEAQTQLGIFYANGNIVEQDYGKAAECYERVAENNNTIAQRKLGLLYDCGIGVERDYNQVINASQLEPADFMGR